MGRRTADKPWQFIVWIIISGFLLGASIHSMATEGIDGATAAIGAAAAYALISSIIRLIQG